MEQGSFKFQILSLSIDRNCMNLTVIGLGYVGLPLAIYSARSGLSVKGFDVDEAKISNLNNGHSFLSEFDSKEILDLLDARKLKFVDKLERSNHSTIFVIAVPTPLTEDRNPDLSMLVSACEFISDVINDGDLVINESTSYIGTLRNLIEPTIQRRSGFKKIRFAVAPERIDPGNPTWHLDNTPRNVAGLTEEAGSDAVNFYQKICGEVMLFKNPEEVEAAKLIENTFRQVNIAFINEISKLASEMNFSIHTAVMAAASKPFGFMPFYPSVGVGGHCIPVDTHYLTYTAKTSGMNLPLVEIANETNISMPNFVVEKIKNKLHFELKNKKIQIVGISYKINSTDTRESPALILIKLLRDQGAIVSWHDPLVIDYQGEKSSPLQPDLDLGLIIAPHDEIDFSIWKSTNMNILDLSSNPKNYGWEKFI